MSWLYYAKHALTRSQQVVAVAVAIPATLAAILRAVLDVTWPIALFAGAWISMMAFGVFMLCDRLNGPES